MTSLPPSVSEATSVPGLASNFDRLHPKVRQWIWEQNWTELREVQELAIEAVMGSQDDVLIAAATAAGKTEAAFFPILSRVAEREEPGLSVLYISPLKALINDQFGRLDQVCEMLELNVVRWHGDASQGAKKRMLKKPSGVALITPESIEALFIRKPKDAYALFQNLEYIVIDELHAFMQGPRGLHLASLLRRIDALCKVRPRRVGLSATIGDLSVAAKWLNPANPSGVAIVNPPGGSPELRLQVRGYIEPPDIGADDLEKDEGRKEALDFIADHIFAHLRGSNNLVFGGSRRRVEAVADRLRRRSEAAGVPNEFFPHHGSLSKELREDLEHRLKAAELPTTAVATTTLELGIDIGSVDSVAQILGPRSLASLRQRLGRSGRRRGKPATLRIYVREKYLTPLSDPMDRLRLEVVRSVAAVELLKEKFVEPPVQDPSIATVALHQTLSIITERGGARAEQLYQAICGDGPLSVLTQADYVELLRAMTSPDTRLIEQAPDRTIMLGEIGEKIAFGRDFYAIFPSDEEWRLVHGGRQLGSIPISNILGIGSLVAFAGRRWRVMGVDDTAKVLTVEPHRSAQIPKFEDPSQEAIHDNLAARMKAVLMGTDIPPYLDQTAQELLVEGRNAFQEMNLATEILVQAQKDTHLLLWHGAAMNSVFAVALSSAGFECSASDIGVTVARATPDDVRAVLKVLAENPLTVEDVADFVQNLQVAKYDELIPTALLRKLWARANAETVERVAKLARRLAASSKDIATDFDQL